jgi:hypothetical protein
MLLLPRVRVSEKSDTTGVNDSHLSMSKGRSMRWRSRVYYA